MIFVIGADRGAEDGGPQGNDALRGLCRNREKSLQKHPRYGHLMDILHLSYICFFFRHPGTRSQEIVTLASLILRIELVSAGKCGNQEIDGHTFHVWIDYAQHFTYD